MKAHRVPCGSLFVVLGLAAGYSWSSAPPPHPAPPPVVTQGEPLQHGVQYEIRSALPASESFDPRRQESRYLALYEPAGQPRQAPPRSKTSRRLEAVSEDRTDHATVRTTAYSHLESDHSIYGRQSAMGGTLKYGTVCSAAADWSRYPVGTKFRIASQPGVTYVVDDYGSALVGSGTIDLYRPTLSSMNDWGTREVSIDVIKWGSYEDSLRLMEDRKQWSHVSRMCADIERRLHLGNTSELAKAKNESQPPRHGNEEAEDAE